MRRLLQSISRGYGCWGLELFSGCGNYSWVWNNETDVYMVPVDKTIGLDLNNQIVMTALEYGCDEKFDYGHVAFPLPVGWN